MCSIGVMLCVCACTVIRADDHNHAADTFAARRGLVLKRIEQAVVQDPTVPVRRMYDRAVDEDSGNSDELPTFGSVRTRAKRSKLQLLPPIPATIDDVVINGNWGKTWRNRQFLSHLDNDWGIVVFCTDRMLRTLQRSECLYVDGTFRTSPSPYCQFLTVHGLYQGHVIPLVFCLSTGKAVGQYRQVLQHLKAEVRRVTHRRLMPTRVVLDFEQALLTALATEFPNAALSGCYFHLNQSLWRHIQELGLAVPYRHDQRIQKAVRKVMAIGFLPVLLVQQNFVMFRNGRFIRRLVQRYPELEDWLEYVETTYIRNNATFPPPMWNVFGRTMDTRTNNHLEGTSLLVVVW